MKAARRKVASQYRWCRLIASTDFRKSDAPKLAVDKTRKGRLAFRYSRGCPIILINGNVN